MSISKRSNKKSTKPTATEVITMRRNGEFRVLATGPSHCGITEDLTIRYDMTAECGPKLDRRGFLFDQVNVDNYFQSIKRTTRSCERLTQFCLNSLKEIILRENPDCQIFRLSLTLTPAPYKAAMTYSWTSKNAPPKVHSA